ncbi:MAG: DUF1810 domain-containing protein [Terracidiphilus sp.]
MDDPFNLGRFVDAQSGQYEQVLAELRAGRKQSHWIWFIFPQLKGLGRSPTAEFYGIGSIDEARAYLRHPVLGRRLEECTALVNEIEGRTIDEIFGFPDNLKFRSSMTLFADATEDNRIFLDALKKYFAGEPDAKTLELMGAKR